MTESQHPRDHGIRSQKETEIDYPSFMLQPAATWTARIADDAPPKRTRNTWPPAQDITVSHCDGLALVGPVQWSPQTEEQGRGLRPRHKACDESKGQLTPAPGKRATERHSMENPKRIVEAEARTKSAFRKRKTCVVCPEELHWAPTKYWRTRERTQEGWPTGQDPRTTRNYAQHKNSWTRDQR